MSKWLSKLLAPLVGTISDSNIKNSYDLVSKLKNNVSPCKLISFDVNSLFTKVPVHDFLRFLRDDLHKLVLPVTHDVFIKLIELCVLNTNFTVNGRFFRQKFGCAMGNPLSPVISNLYMEYFETRFLPTICNFRLPWYRYVDDILCLWPKNVDPHQFLGKLNSLVPSISFKIEEENNHTLPFLDTLIINNNGQFKFKVYRKPTLVDSYIHYFSYHHIKIKMSVFSGMFLRALRVCDPEYLDEEFKFIYNLASKLCYPVDLIDRCLVKAEKTFYNVDIKIPFSVDNLLVLPFQQEFTSLVTSLKHMNINVVFNYDNTIKSSLIKNSPNNDSGGVYIVPCKDCNDVYVGQTGKCLKDRIKQHRQSVMSAQESNGIFKHRERVDHNIDWDASKIIYWSSCHIERLFVESALIRCCNHTMNLNDGLYKIDNISLNMIYEVEKVKIARQAIP